MEERKLTVRPFVFELFSPVEKGVGVRKAGTQRAVRSEVKNKSKARTYENKSAHFGFLCSVVY